MRKFLKIFFIYSYTGLFLYVGSENALNILKYMNGEKDGNGNKKKLKFESLWKDTFKRFRECYKLIKEN